MREEVIWETSYGRHTRLDEFCGDHVDKTIYFFTAIGHQDRETATKIFEATYGYLKSLPPILALTDLSRIDGFSLATTWFAAMQIKKHRALIAKSAVFGLAPKIFIVVNAVLRSAKRGDIRIFETKDEAIAWLLQD